MKNLLKPLLGLTLFFFIVGCDPKETEVVLESKLVKADLVSSFTTAQFAERLKGVFGAQSSQISLLLRSGIKQYKIVYKTTTPEGNEITASGALVIPTDLKEPLALGSYQHGTIFNDADAPSNFSQNSEASIGAFLAATGFIMAMPDYLGYGESKSYPHPYEHALGLGQGNVDFLLAVKDFLEKEKVNWNKNLLLAGYSEGGYATLATQKLLEEKYAGKFNIKASSVGAGAYSKTLTVENFLKNKTSGEVVNNRSYVWVLLTYNRLYNINSPTSTYFLEPYATDIKTNGYSVTINKSFDEILKPDFKASILDKSNMAWVNAFAANDLTNFKTNVPTKFFHGDKDTYVPFLNSEAAVQGLKAKGSPSVTLERITGGNHGSSVNAYYLGTLDMFNLNKN